MSIDWFGIRRVFREHAYQNRLRHRQGRILEDFHWNTARAKTAFHAMHLYEDRTGLPAWTCRPLVSDDLPPMPRRTRGESLVYAALRLVDRAAVPPSSTKGW